MSLGLPLLQLALEDPHTRRQRLASTLPQTLHQRLEGLVRVDLYQGLVVSRQLPEVREGGLTGEEAIRAVEKGHGPTPFPHDDEAGSLSLPGLDLQVAREFSFAEEKEDLLEGLGPSLGDLDGFAFGKLQVLYHENPRPKNSETFLKKFQCQFQD